VWLAAFKIGFDFFELGEGGAEVFADFGGDDAGGGEVGAVFESLIFEPEDNE
jgi:hypothetical protein